MLLKKKREILLYAEIFYKNKISYSFNELKWLLIWNC